MTKPTTPKHRTTPLSGEDADALRRWIRQVGVHDVAGHIGLAPGTVANLAAGCPGLVGTKHIIRTYLADWRQSSDREQVAS